MRIIRRQYRPGYPAIFLFFLLSLLLQSGCVWHVRNDSERQPRVVAFVPGWKNVKTMDINASSITHILYAFVKIKPNGIPYLPDPGDEENLYYLTSLKEKNPQLKVLLSVGGWKGSKYFSDVAKTDSSRRKFVGQLVVLVTMYNLDGVDIDWEYPGQTGAGNHYLPEDKWNYSLLLEDLRVALNRIAFLRNDNHHYLLTIDAAARQNWLDHVDISEIIKVVDFINLMTYDYYGEWDNRTGHHTNLFTSFCEPYGNSVNQSVILFEHAGVPADKIVIGGAFFGHWWNRVDKNNRGLCQVARGKGGTVSYRTIVDSIMKIPGYKKYWDRKARAPYLWNEKEAVFVTYDDPRSIKEKARYVRKKKLGGIMFREYPGDLNGELLDAIHKGLGK